ncbi:MAG: hypothetical protein F6K28_12850 [Microcoleus sp. SIO2G3]|nr:hypothetical protein [Microcoleus sp. SIO2G3]
MLLSITLPLPTKTNFHSIASENFYQQLQNLSNTIISIQYNPNSFLTFKVQEASFGSIVRQGNDKIAIRCQVRGTTYTFTHEHLDQMSKRELNDLLNHLGLDSLWSF